ncbi:MAG: threonine synthase [Nanoarchaeota archaeon]|nr:threonine synthase [Nanoarchaeota archaeon]MBU1135771.1 threonine synthase [Nanoarchaeota archaeon]
MYEKYIFCFDCGKEYATNTVAFRCGRCDGSLEIVYDYNKIKHFLSLKKLRRRPFNHARYKEFFPIKKLISIDEGGTPLIRAKNLENDLGLKFQLYFKNEAINPTGSFKDRGSSVEIARALEKRAKRVVCASTGNMGASVAAYSAMSNLRCHIFVPNDAIQTKIEQILAYGADVFQVRGNYEKAAEMVERAFMDHRGYLTGDYLFRREGTKSVGFEIAEQVNADYVFCPIGNGTLISATWKAFEEFQKLGFIRKLPKMVGIQSSRCNPIVKAFRKKSKTIEPVHGSTIAVAIECGNPLDGKRALGSVKESKGFSEGVSDREILRVRELLARREGLFAEPAGAVALTGLLKYKHRIKRGSKVVCVITGHGLKTPMTGTRGHVKKVKADPNIVDSLLK